MNAVLIASILALAIVCVPQANAQSNSQINSQTLPELSGGVVTTVVSSKVVTIPIDINSQTVKFSRAGYSMPVVKILVPALADVTIMNHRNEKEGAPCLAAWEAKSPADVIQDRPGHETADLKIELLKSVEVLDMNVSNPDGSISKVKRCQVLLNEVITGTIRGQEFFHDRAIELPQRDLADCR